jgi:FtsZ-interacting cell division protein YlmF
MSEEQNNILKRLLKLTRPAGVEEQIIPRSEQRSETSSTGGGTASEGESEDRASERDEDEVTPEEEARLQEEWNRPAFVPRKPNEEDVEVIKKAMSNRIPKPVAEAPSTRSQGMVTRGRQMTSQINSVVHKDPKKFREAKNSALWMQWQESMREEVEALKARGTFTMIVREPNMTTLHSKWVYKTKTLSDGQIERFKSRLVACGNEQVHG